MVNKNYLLIGTILVIVAVSFTIIFSSNLIKKDFTPNSDGNILLTGTVIGHEDKREIDGDVQLILDTEYGKIYVSYDYTELPCINGDVFDFAQTLKKGDKVIVFGEYTGSQYMSVCDSLEHYIKFVNE